MRGLAVFVGLLCGLAPAAQAQSEAEQRALWERGQATQRAFEHRLFTEAGFPSITELLADGREVRRVLLRDPYGMLPVPGLEIERLGDGRVTLRFQYYGWSTGPVELDRSAWDELAAIEQEVFARPPFQPMARPATPGPPPPPPPICHGWLIRFEADRERTASWSACGNGTDHPGFRYAVRAVQLAMRSKPDCMPEGSDLFWAFNGCFAAKPALDDPVLEATFAVLRKEYDEAPGAERLAEARRALRAPGLALGSSEWLAARAAVARFKEIRDLRRDRLNQVVRLFYGAPNLPDADRAKLKRTIEGWTDFVEAQERNYAELLQDLTWPEGSFAPSS